MKRIICLFFVFCLSLCLISCTGQNAENHYYQNGYLKCNDIQRYTDVEQFYMSSSMLSSIRANIQNKEYGNRILSAIGNVKAEKIDWNDELIDNDKLQQVFVNGIQINFSEFALFIGTDGTVVLRDSDSAYITESFAVDYNTMKNMCKEIATKSDQLF